MTAVNPLFAGPLGIRIKGQQINTTATRSLPLFYRNLEEALDGRRASQSLYSIVENHWRAEGAVDFCSNDILSFGTSGILRKEFLAELAKNPDFSTGSGGSRLIDGNYPYLEKAEREIADFHGAEEGLIVGSGFDGNVAIWTAIPRPGDVILYDALVHASTMEGMAQSLAAQKVEFPHNDVEAFREILLSILNSQPQVMQGRRSVLVAVESVYSMDGDVCPLAELVECAKDLHDEFNVSIHFVVDEAHSTGLLGPQGSGLVCGLGLEKDIAVRLHTFGKAMSASGAILLGNKTIKTALINFPRSFIFTTAPSLPFVAAMRAGCNLLKSEEARKAQEHVQNLSKFFFESITSHPEWEMAQEKGLLSIPLAKDWEDRQFYTHIVTIHTRHQYTYWLYFHLIFSSFCVFPVEFPVVPVGQSRLKVTFHAGNTEEEIERFVETIFAWVDEIVNIEDGGTGEKVTSAASQVYAWMRREGLSGYGMV